MFSTLRKFLVIFLTMLQLIAPLVHAHASETGSTQGLHVPGLEHYNAEPDRLIAQLTTVQYDVAADGLIVGVDIGQQSRTPPRMDADNSYYLPQQALVFNTAVSCVKAHFSGLPPQLAHRLLIPSPPPRAPPA